MVSSKAPSSKAAPPPPPKREGAATPSRQLAPLPAKNQSMQGDDSERAISQSFADQYGIPIVELDGFDVDPTLRDLVPKSMAGRFNLVPLSRTGNTLVICMADPSNIQAIDDVRFATKLNIEVVVATPSSIQKKIDAIYSSGYQYSQVIASAEQTAEQEITPTDDIEVQTIKGDTTEAPIIRLVNLFLLDAIRKGASDIHVEPYDKKVRVRFRVDGMLNEIMEPPYKYKEQIAARLKIMADLDIAEKRLPQDGRIKIRTRKGREIDFRVSALPTMYGEKIVLRILDQESLQLDMTKLGFEEDELKKLRMAIAQPWGMCLVTGPTGSGKTTTLYSALMELNSIDTNISTAEDPVEYQLMGINQVQMNDDIGLNFAAALRAFLRQDPDIIMVGEIRDYETAEIAIKAALTGHMVLSTLHTNDAPSTVTRLIHMGIEPFLISSALTLVQAQRLIRKLCPQCKRQTKVPESRLKELGIPENEMKNYEIYEPGKCPACSHSGYKGRLGIYEVMPFSENLKEMIMNGATATELKKEAMKEGMRTLRGSALMKLKRGLTSIEEVMRSSIAD